MQTGTLKVEFINETRHRVEPKNILSHLEQVHSRLTNHRGNLSVGSVPVKLEIELVLVGDEKIKSLNEKFRGVDSATDVLSFDAPELDLPASIVISLDTATIQAEQAGITLESELKMLATHGLLHIAGFNHK